LVDEVKQQQQTPGNAVYLLLLAAQIAGAILFVWHDLPEFERLLIIRASSYRETFAPIWSLPVFLP
jgi:hypothetical protein